MQDEDSQDSVYTFVLNGEEEVMDMPRYEAYDEKTQQLIMDEYVSSVNVTWHVMLVNPSK